MRHRRLLLFMCVTLGVSCSGIVIVPGDDEASAAGAATSGMTTGGGAGSSTTTASGPGSCATDADCAGWTTACGPGVCAAGACTSPGCPGASLWSNLSPGDIGVFVDQTAADDQGGAVVAGPYYSIDFGLGPLPYAGSTSAGYIVKFGPGGAPLWQYSFSSDNWEAVDEMVVSPSGEISFTASVWGTVDFGAGPFVAGKPFEWHRFLINLSSLGQVTKIRELPGVQQMVGAPNGDTILAGSAQGVLQGSIAIDGQVLSCAPDCVYLARFSPAGTLLSLGALEPEWQNLCAIAADGQGNLLLLGTFAGTLSAGGKTLMASAQGSSYLIALDPSGHVLSARAIDGGCEAHNLSAAGAGPGGFVLAGIFSGPLALGDGAPVVDAAPPYLAVLKVDPSGKVAWSRTVVIHPAPDAYLSSVGADAQGSAVLFGAFGGKIDPMAGIFDAGMGLQTIAFKLHPDGSFGWSREIQKAASQLSLLPITFAGGVSPNGHVVVAMDVAFYWSVDLGGGLLQTPDYGIAVGMYAP